MSAVESLQRFCCSLATESHFAFNPARINCGHPICSRCICKLTRDSKCKLCDRSIDIADIDVSYTGIQKMIDASMEEITSALKEQFYDSIQNLKKSMATSSERIHSQCVYLKDEIEIRIESVKAKLDELREKLKDELDEQAMVFMRHQVDTIDVSRFEIILTKLEADVEKNKKLSQTALQKYQDRMLEVKNTISELDNFRQAPFVINENENIDESVIGTWSEDYKNLNILADLGNKMRFKQYKEVDIEVTNRAYVLSDNLIAFCDQQKQVIRIYNDLFEQVQLVERINNETISPTHIVSNLVDKYYIIDSKKTGAYRDYTNRVFITDFAFQCIRSRKINQILEAKSLLCYRNSIFVVDTASSEILKLNDNLDIVRSISLKESNENFICDAKIVNDLLCVRFISNFMNIYDIRTMKLIMRHDRLDGQLLSMNHNSNLFSLEHDKINYFDNNGSLIARITTLLFDEFTQFEIDFKLYFSNKFVFYSVTRGKLIVFECNSTVIH